ncbi:MAG: hypothetical protein Q4B87_00345 [Candidatus Saccharibacteria bacterium]|nr:hypothetical protein [Candidatus Saccharibacteria bacterium]
MLEYITSFAIPILYFMAITATLVFLTKKSFGKCLPLGMILSAFLLFFSQLMFNTFTVGFVIGIICAVAAIPLAIFKRKELSEFKKLYFTSGFVVFLVIYVLVYIYDLNRGFTMWDELSHWGMMVKEMVRLDRFYSIDASNLMVHKDYPPIMQLFELFWVKLCGGFSEPYVERALHTFELSLIVPFVAEKIAEKKNFWKSVMVGVATVGIVALIILFFDGHLVIGTVYIDYVMALLVVYLLMTIMASSRISWFEIASIMAGGSFLLLLKQMGLPLYLLIICFLVGMVFLRKKVKVKRFFKELNIKKTIFYLIMLAVPFVVWLVWGGVVDGIEKQFSLSDLSVSEFLRIMMGRGESWQTVTRDNYLMALGNKSISTSFIGLSFLQVIGLFVGGMWLVWFLFKRTLQRKEMIFTTIILVIGAIGYAVAMLMLYTTSFGEAEGPKLASYDRYMGTYAMILILMVAMILIWRGTIEKKTHLIYGALIIALILNSPVMLGQLYPSIRRKSGTYTHYEDEAKKLVKMVGDGESVYVIARELSTTGEYHFFTQYYGDTIKLSDNYYKKTWPTIDKAESKRYYKEVVLPDIVENYNYLVVAETDKELEPNYCESLKICPLIKGNVYKVVIDDDGVLNRYEFVGNIYQEDINE